MGNAKGGELAFIALLQGTLEKILKEFWKQKNAQPLKIKTSFTEQEQEHAACFQRAALLFLSETAPSASPIHPALPRTQSHDTGLTEVFVAPAFEKHQEKWTE